MRMEGLPALLGIVLGLIDVATLEVLHDSSYLAGSPATIAPLTTLCSSLSIKNLPPRSSIATEISSSRNARYSGGHLAETRGRPGRAVVDVDRPPAEIPDRLGQTLVSHRSGSLREYRDRGGESGP
jgi:hypothetical protein